MTYPSTKPWPRFLGFRAGSWVFLHSPVVGRSFLVGAPNKVLTVRLVLLLRRGFARSLGGGVSVTHVVFPFLMALFTIIATATVAIFVGSALAVGLGRSSVAVALFITLSLR